MSFIGTLAKVAIGVALAKGVGSMIAKSNAGGGTTDTAGAPRSPQPSTKTAQSGGLGDLLEQFTGAATPAAKDASPGAGRSGSPSGGGLDEIIGQLSKGGLGDLLGQIAGTIVKSNETAAPGKVQQAGPQKGFGELLNEALQKAGEPEAKPTPNQEAMAALMLRAMIQAAKADGEIDAGEKKKLLEKLQDANDTEMAFVQRELAAPVSVEGLVRQVPKGLEGQVYAMSVLAIALDNKNEAQYLHQLAQGLGISPAQVNQMHAQLGVTALYS